MLDLCLYLDEHGTSQLVAPLTNAQSMAANLRIMANISGHNEAEDAALVQHRHSTAITHETMDTGLQCDKPERGDEYERFVAVR